MLDGAAARPEVELVIFDCDGVLIDSEMVGCRVELACLGEIGIAISLDEIIERYVGLTVATMLADLEQRHGRKLPPDFAETLRRRTAAAFDTELRAIPGIEAALAGLTQKRCVASSSGPGRLRHTLGLVGLYDRFAPDIFSATQVARGKPAPDLFLFAAARMGVVPQRCLVIEDSIAGVQAARAAGMRVLGFLGGSHCRPGHGERLRREGAESVFSEMAQLARLLVTPR